MDVLEFCRGIDLMEEAVAVVQSFEITKEDCDRSWKLCCEDYEAFCNEVRGKERFRGRMLAYLCRFSCEVYEMYRERGIADKVFWDTLQDIRNWCVNCYREFGEYGIDEMGWFWRHLTLTIFKLGRLQFEKMTTPFEVKATVNGVDYCIPKGASVINIHIPQDEPLSWPACEQSFAQAFEWFGKEIPYVCHSWLLYPGLKELLGEDSNIIQFQNHFTIFATDFKRRDAERYIFGTAKENPADYPERTRLQKAARQYLMEGKQLGNAIGRYIPVHRSL